LTAFVRAALGETVLAVYVSGSLIEGDFEPASSDIDVLVVTHELLSARACGLLGRVHGDLARHHAWGDRLEGGYAARGQLRPWGIEGTIAAIEPGGRLTTDSPSDFTAENMVAIRMHAVTLYGLPPAQVLPVTPRATFDAALVAYLGELRERLRRPDLLAPETVASAVLNIARCRFGLRTGLPSTKREAAVWLGAQEPRLGPTLDASLAVRRGARDAPTLETLRNGIRPFADSGVSRLGDGDMV
jgi:hypothetical protein